MSLTSGSRPSPFTLQEFSELVCSAFNISDADLTSRLNQPLLSLTPASPHSPSPPDRIQPPNFLSRGRKAGDPRRSRSSSLDDRSPLSSPARPRSRSGTISARRMFQQVRSRASALVLRSREPPASPSRPPSPAPYEPLPRPCPSPTLSASSFVRALSPWSMLDSTADRPSSRAPSPSRSLLTPTRRSVSPTPLPTRQVQSYGPSVSRSPTSALRSFFDDTPVQSKRAYSRHATSASVVHPLYRVTTSNSVQEGLPHESLPSFFEDTGYRVANPRPPSYCRPVPPSTAIHSRLPPLRKTKSSGHGLLGREDHQSSARKIDGPAMRVGFQDFALWNSRKGENMPSPLTHPRDPPPVPAYVYERRGSATSNSTGSTRSSSSLSLRLSSLVELALPSKMRIRGRSKLNLNTASGSEEASADSSPSTLSSGSLPSTPSSPISPFSRAQAQVYSASTDDHTLPIPVTKPEEDALAIGRVLTPEADPFAKGDIVLPTHGSPRQPIHLSRRASSQDSPSSLNRVVTWDDQGKPHAVKRVRNSLPASPVSTAPTFPSSCSVYSSCSPRSDASYTFPARKSPAITPKRDGPPSAWPSLVSTSSSSGRPATSPCSPKSAFKRNSKPLSSTNDIFSALPVGLPPPFPPPSLPPPNRDLPSVPLSSPRAPSLPPKERHGYISRSHRSLPPSPHPSQTEPSGDHSLNLRTSDDAHVSIIPLSLALQECSVKAFPDRRQVVEAPSLGEPWSGTIGNMQTLGRPATPIPGPRRISKRRSTDSTSTITASPCSSALHDTTPGFDSRTFAASRDGSVLTEGSSYSIEASPRHHSNAVLEDEAEFWSPRSSQSAVFYAAPSSLEASERSRFHTSMAMHSAPRVPTWRAEKAASAEGRS
ncbi:hypothetical protein BD310DRAFT_444417 [Dichomitus squalens]|uniref:Uncharacterized protein n=1 Tax=Dichomitus squalens TaxID=114155 RepID=A0A4Q9PW32_9APHY|nr:hypothetical protein BD310DRAFT_444417 [Dichomitus squalens]